MFNRRVAAATLGVAALLLLAASPAAADAQDSTDDYYVGNSGGQIQCARYRQRFTTASDNYVETFADTLARKDIYCSNALVLPAGWLGEQHLIERNDNAIVADSTMRYSSTSASLMTYTPVHVWPSTPTVYRGVTAHRVLIVGGWKDTVTSTLWRWSNTP